MGSRSSSASSPTTTTNTTVENTNLQGIEGTAIVGGEGDISFEVTDQGAVDSAFDFAGTTVDEAFDFGGNALDALSGASNRVLDLASQFARESLGLVERSAGAAQRSFEGALASTLSSLDEEQSGGAQRVMLVAALALVAVVGLGYVLKGR